MKARARAVVEAVLDELHHTECFDDVIDVILEYEGLDGLIGKLVPVVEGVLEESP